MLAAAYNMLKDGTLYQDLGPNISTTSQRQARSATRQPSANLGFDVQITQCSLIEGLFLISGRFNTAGSGAGRKGPSGASYCAYFLRNLLGKVIVNLGVVVKALRNRRS